MASVLRMGYQQLRRKAGSPECVAEKKLRGILTGEQAVLFIDVLDDYISFYDEFAWRCYKTAFRKGVRKATEVW